MPSATTRRLLTEEPRAVLVQVPLELGHRNQDAPAEPHDAQVRKHLRVERVTTHRQGQGRLDGSERQPGRVLFTVHASTVSASALRGADAVDAVVAPRPDVVETRSDAVV